MSEWKHSVVDLADNSTTVSSVPALFKGYYVHTALSAHVCPIKDGTSTEVFSIAASKAAETLFELKEPVRFEDSIVVDPNDAATGQITVFYRDLEPL